VDITPSPRILRMLGEIEFDEWQCIASWSITHLTTSAISGRPARPGRAANKVSVTLQAREPASRLRVIVRDTVQGMKPREARGRRACGWSSNDRFDKLGLFGMGFQRQHGQARQPDAGSHHAGR